MQRSRVPSAKTRKSRNIQKTPAKEDVVETSNTEDASEGAVPSDCSQEVGPSTIDRDLDPAKMNLEDNSEPEYAEMQQSVKQLSTLIDSLEVRTVELSSLNIPEAPSEHELNIDRFGILYEATPIVVDSENNVLAGHNLLRILKSIDRPEQNGILGTDEIKTWLLSRRYKTDSVKVRVLDGEADLLLIPLVPSFNLASAMNYPFFEALSLARRVYRRFVLKVVPGSQKKTGLKMQNVKSGQIIITHVMTTAGIDSEVSSSMLPGIKACALLSDDAFALLEELITSLQNGSAQFSTETDVPTPQEIHITPADSPLAEGAPERTNFWNYVPQLFRLWSSDKVMWKRVEGIFGNIVLSRYKALQEAQLLDRINDIDELRVVYFRHTRRNKKSFLLPSRFVREFAFKNRSDWDSFQLRLQEASIAELLDLIVTEPLTFDETSVAPSEHDSSKAPPTLSKVISESCTTTPSAASSGSDLEDLANALSGSAEDCENEPVEKNESSGSGDLGVTSPISDSASEASTAHLKNDSPDSEASATRPANDRDSTPRLLQDETEIIDSSPRSSLKRKAKHVEKDALKSMSRAKRNRSLYATEETDSDASPVKQRPPEVTIQPKQKQTAVTLMFDCSERLNTVTSAEAILRTIHERSTLIAKAFDHMHPASLVCIWLQPRHASDNLFNGSFRRHHAFVRTRHLSFDLCFTDHTENVSVEQRVLVVLHLQRIPDILSANAENSTKHAQIRNQSIS